MTIAAHLSHSGSAGQNLLLQQLIRLAEKNTADHYIFFASNTHALPRQLPPNVTPVTVSPVLKSSLAFSYWYQYKLPGLLARYNATVFISEHNYLSTRTTVPQYFYIRNYPKIIGEKNSNNIFPSRKKYEQFLTIAAGLLFPQKFILDKFLENFPAHTSKVKLVPHGMSNRYQPLNFLQKMGALTRFSEDNEYFIVPVSASTAPQLTTLLKAFSIFKKWQKSSMKLLLMLHNLEEEGLIPGFRSYKFRSEVIVLRSIETDQDVLVAGGAYAGIFFPTPDKLETFGLEILKAAVPLICPAYDNCKTTFAGAAMYFDGDEEKLASSMQLLYKDEQLRNRLIGNAAAVIGNYESEKNSNHLYSVLALHSGS